MFLALCIGVGIAWVRRRLGLTGWSESLVVGLTLTQAFLLLQGNLSLRLGGWPSWPWGLWVLFFSLGLGAAVSPQPPLADKGRLPASVGLLSLAAVGVACLLQTLRVDDDYWIHTPIQGMLALGDFPPHNLYFPGIALEGHYGRDLLIVVWSRLTGWSIFTCQYLLTSVLQAAQLLLVYWAIRRGGDRPQAIASAFFVAGLVQFGGRCGLLVILRNNNPVVHTYWALVLYLLVQTFALRQWRWAILLGLVLGSYSIVYETHFCLCYLACLTAIAADASWSPRPAESLKLGLGALGVATVLACTQGGPITELATRPFNSARHEINSAIGMRTQNQHVELHFPKEKLFQIRCQPSPNRWSEPISENVTLERYDQMTDPGQGYAPFWDLAILRLHSLGLFLSPLSLWWAWKHGNLAGLWLCSFGCLAFLTPAVVDFGPVFESEYMRWEFAAALAFSAAFGQLAGPHLERDLFNRRPRWSAPLWICLLLYCSRDFRQNWRDWRAETLDASARGGPVVYTGAQEWVTHQPILDFSAEDWAAARWLRERSHLGERVVVNPLVRPHQVAFESTLTGLTGLYGSRRLPFDTDVVGLVPARQRADVQCFLASGDPHYLELHPAEWALLRYPFPPMAPQGGHGVTWSLVGARCLGEIRHRRPDWPLSPASPLPGEVVAVGLPAQGDEGQLYPVQWKLSLVPAGEGRLVVGAHRRGEASDPEDWIGYRLGVAAVWSAPYQAGSYQLDYWWWNEGGLHPLAGSTEIEVDSLARLRRARLLSLDVGPSRVHCRIQAPLTKVKDYVGGVIFQSAEVSTPFDQFDRLEPVNFVPVAGLKDTWEVDFPANLPSPGVYRVDALLSPYHGTAVRLRGVVQRVGHSRD